MATIDRWFEDFVVGESRLTSGRTVTEADIVLHAGQTGDFFPHHMDAHWCATQPFGQRIAHGTLILSMAVGSTAVDINPQSMSYGYDRIRFLKPVFIGDTITTEAVISELLQHRKSPELYGYVHEKTVVSNQHGEAVLVFTHLYLVNRRGDAT